MTTSCNLTESQLAMVTKATDTNYFRQHFFVNIQNLQNCQDSGKLLLNLPNVWHEPIILTHKYINYTDENNYVYQGKLNYNVNDEDSLFYARLLLIAENGAKFGQLKINGKVYTIYDLNTECHMIVEMNPIRDSILTDNCQRAPLETDIHGDENHYDYSEPNFCGSCIADVYFFATSAANSADPSILQTARTSLEIMNVSIAKSEVPGAGSQLRFRLRGIDVLTGFVETTSGIDPGTDGYIDLLSFSVNSTVTNRRNTTQSDVMVLLTDDVYKGLTGSILGIVQAVAYPYFDNGFHLSTFNSAAAYHTIPHEFGYLIGCQHQTQVQGSFVVTDAFAHAFQKKRINRSLFTNVGSFANGSGINPVQLDNYSTPDVSVSDMFTGQTVIGTPNLINNALQIGNHGCELANLFPNAPTVTIWIEGPKVVCQGQPATYTLKTNCLGNFSNVTWEYSYTGFAWNTFNGGSTFTLNVANFVPGEVLFIRAKMGFSGTYYFTHKESDIDVFASPCVVQYKVEPTKPEITSPLVSIFPNPSTSEFNITIETENNAEFDNQNIDIIDIYGKKVFSSKVMMPNPGITQLTLDASGLRKGLYFILLNNKSYVIEKL